MMFFYTWVQLYVAFSRVQHPSVVAVYVKQQRWFHQEHSLQGSFCGL